MEQFQVQREFFSGWICGRGYSPGTVGRILYWCHVLQLPIWFWLEQRISYKAHCY